MTTEEIITGNRLIAEFMGLIKEDGYYGVSHELMPYYHEFSTRSISVNDEGILDEDGHNHLYAINDRELEYHKNWNWLMSVVEKIENTTVEGTTQLYGYLGSDETKAVEQQFSVEIKDSQCVINMDVLPQYHGTVYDFLSLYSCLNRSKIEAVYKAVLQFITWYNSQQK